MGVWVSAWGGRGPLSTTITTDQTFVDAVPHLSGRTLRTVAALTTGGTRVRVRFSQRFSAFPLRVGEARVAASVGGQVVGPDQTLTFGGRPEAVVPAGDDLWSDPADLPVSAGDLAISMYLPDPFVPTTQGGRGMTKTSYHAPGNQCGALTLRDAQTTRQVFGAFEVQVFSPEPAETLAALGDSITEGAGSTLDADGSWPDQLARRLNAGLGSGGHRAVFNAGIGSGRLASADAAGLRGLRRLDELLTLPQLTWVIVLMGLNDISYEGVDARFLQDAWTQALNAVHRAGKRLAVVPLLPFGRSVKDQGKNVEVARRANDWLRAHGPGTPGPAFDAVWDLEAAVRDPRDPGWSLRPSLTLDGVHPNQAGYTALAEAIPLDKLIVYPH